MNRIEWKYFFIFFLTYRNVFAYTISSIFQVVVKNFTTNKKLFRRKSFQAVALSTQTIEKNDIETLK